jgi:hypothetical protein
MLPLIAYLHARIATAPSAGSRLRADAGQATAEYALVLVGAAAVAVMLIGWATRTDRIGQLLDAVVDNISGRIG